MEQPRSLARKGPCTIGAPSSLPLLSHVFRPCRTASRPGGHLLLLLLRLRPGLVPSRRSFLQLGFDAEPSIWGCSCPHFPPWSPRRVRLSRLGSARGSQQLFKEADFRPGPSPHLFQILIPIVTFSLAMMDVSSPATLQSISKSIIQPSVLQPMKKLSKGEPMALGITQILIGILKIAFGLVKVMAEGDITLYYAPADHAVIPYWMGILYIISGSLSVAVAKNPKIALVKGMLAMNVVSAVAAGIGIIMLSISVAHPEYYYICDRYYTRSMPPEMCHEFLVIPYIQMKYICAILLAFTVLEFLIAITTAAFGCASVCRNAFSETTVVIFQNTTQEAPPAVLTPVKEDETP